MMANFMSFLASTTLNLDLCSDFMEVVVRQASFPSLISQICLLFFTMPLHSIQISHFVVLEIDLRQATILTSEFHCPVPRLLWRSNSYFTPLTERIPSQI